MGRRKINIEPITQERNRTVTFIKRKAGLFKKAHELAVLCQVDVAVIILGHNNTFYEFSSVDTGDLIRHYQSPDLVHDVKEPSDFGDYVKKERVELRKNRRRGGIANKRSLSPSLDDAVERGGLKKHIRSQSQILAGERHSGSISNRRERNSDMEDDDDDDEDDDDEVEEAEGVELASLPTLLNKGSKLAKAARVGVRGTDSGSSPTVNSISNMQSPFVDLKHSGVKSHGRTSGMEMNEGLKFNPLQEHVQRQFHNLYNSKEPRLGTPIIQPQMVNSSFGRSTGSTASGTDLGSKLAINSPMTALRNMLGSATTPSPTGEAPVASSLPPMGADSKLRESGPSKRPILRVEIPTNNSTPPIKTDEDSGLSESNSKSAVNQQNTPSNVMSHALTSSPVIEEKPKTAGMSANGNGFLTNGLGSGFAASPSVPQYFATPLQGQNSSSVLQISNPQNYLMQKQLQFAQLQQQQQMQQQPQQQRQGPQLLLQNQQQQFQPLSRTLRTHIRSDNSQVENSSGPLTGSLPSKFAHDLIVHSPTTSVGGMFQEWPFPQNAASIGRSSSVLPHLQTYQQNPSNGSSGLSPYINVTQTPTSKAFNFGDVTIPSSNQKRAEEKQ